MKEKLNLNEIFENIDIKLIEREIPITHRFLEATTEVSNMFNVPISIN